MSQKIVYFSKAASPNIIKRKRTCKENDDNLKEEDSSPMLKRNLY